jgi:hypothetical protein
MAKGTWAYQGEEAFNEGKRAKKEADAKRAAMGPWRYRLKNGTSGRATVIDRFVIEEKNAFMFWEHGLKIDGNYRQYTCSRGAGWPCEPCEEGAKKSYVWALTVINHKKRKTESGVTLQHTKELLILKGKAKERMENLAKKGKLFRGAVFEFVRGDSETEVSTGAEIDYIGKRSDEKLAELCPEDILKEAGKGKQGVDKNKAQRKARREWMEPFDYFTVLAPRPHAEMRQILGLGDETKLDVSDVDDAEDEGLEADETEEELDEEEEGSEEEDDDEKPRKPKKPKDKKPKKPKKSEPEEEEEDDDPDEDPDEDPEEEEDDPDEAEEEEDEKPRKPKKPSKPEKPAGKKPKKPKKPKDEEEEEDDDEVGDLL